MQQTLTIIVQYNEDYHGSPPSGWDWSALATMDDGACPVDVTIISASATGEVNGRNVK